MEKMNDLKDLLKHEVLDLYSAEQQMIEAMPAMIEKAKDSTLKKALQEHLRITEKQKTRLDKVKQLLGEGTGEDVGNSQRGFFSSLFKGIGEQKCKGVEGLIEESEKVMSEDMTPEVLDAAIIASAQKLEHYEICGYGTAKAYARQLNLREVAALLDETLNEEYQADDRLTDLAVGGLNEEAEESEEGQGNRRSRSNGIQTSSGKSGNPATSKPTASKGGKKSAASKKSAGKSSSGSRGASKSTRTNSSKKSGSRSGSKSAGRKKSSSRGR